MQIEKNGKKNTTSCISGVQTWFKQVEKFDIHCIWCGIHQLDLVSQKVYRYLSDDTFINTLTGMSTYLLCQQNLQMEIKTTCPKFVSTPWLSMKRITQWLVNYFLYVLSYLKLKKWAFKPSLKWWVVLLPLNAMETILWFLRTRLQVIITLISQQDADFKEL